MTKKSVFGTEDDPMDWIIISVMRRIQRNTSRVDNYDNRDY